MITNKLFNSWRGPCHQTSLVSEGDVGRTNARWQRSGAQRLGTRSHSQKVYNPSDTCLESDIFEMWRLERAGVKVTDIYLSLLGTHQQDSITMTRLFLFAFISRSLVKITSQSRQFHRWRCLYAVSITTKLHPYSCTCFQRAKTMAAAVISKRHYASATHLWGYDAGRVFTSKLSSSVRAKEFLFEKHGKECIVYLRVSSSKLMYIRSSFLYLRLCYLSVHKRWRIAIEMVIKKHESCYAFRVSSLVIITVQNFQFKNKTLRTVFHIHEN